MGFKKYVVFSVIFIIAIYGYIFSLELGSYRVSILEISINLPVSIWFILPLVILFLATIFHILFYGLINSFKQRSINKDHETMINLLKALLQGQIGNKKFKTKGFKNLSSIINQFNINVKDANFSSSDEELNTIVSNIQEIKEGKFVNNKVLKLNEVSNLANLNMLNKVNEQIDFAVDVLKRPENYSANVVKQAFENILREKSMTTVKKLYKNVKLDKDLVKKLFEKDAQNNEFGFTQEEVLELVKDLKFNKDDFVWLAKNYETVLQPDETIKLFEKLSSEVEEAIPAYLHVLCEFEMIDKVRDILSSTPEEEYTPFKALLDLKEAGKYYSLDAISYK